jgi:hypothetical protein
MGNRAIQWTPQRNSSLCRAKCFALENSGARGNNGEPASKSEPANNRGFGGSKCCTGNQRAPPGWTDGRNGSCCGFANGIGHDGHGCYDEALLGFETRFQDEGLFDLIGAHFFFFFQTVPKHLVRGQDRAMEKKSRPFSVLGVSGLLPPCSAVSCSWTFQSRGPPSGSIRLRPCCLLLEMIQHLH